MNTLTPTLKWDCIGWTLEFKNTSSIGCNIISFCTTLGRIECLFDTIESLCGAGIIRYAPCIPRLHPLQYPLLHAVVIYVCRSLCPAGQSVRNWRCSHVNLDVELAKAFSWAIGSIADFLSTLVCGLFGIASCPCAGSWPCWTESCCHLQLSTWYSFYSPWTTRSHFEASCGFVTWGTWKFIRVHKCLGRTDIHFSSNRILSSAFKVVKPVGASKLSFDNLFWCTISVIHHAYQLATLFLQPTDSYAKLSVLPPIPVNTWKCCNDLISRELIIDCFSPIIQLEMTRAVHKSPVVWFCPHYMEFSVLVPVVVVTLHANHKTIFRYSIPRLSSIPGVVFSLNYPVQVVFYNKFWLDFGTRQCPSSVIPPARKPAGNFENSFSRWALAMLRIVWLVIKTRIPFCCSVAWNFITLLKQIQFNDPIAELEQIVIDVVQYLRNL